MHDLTPSLKGRSGERGPPATMPGARPARNLALDGLRGLAAMVVLLHHVAILLAPRAVFGTLMPGASAWDWVAETPLFIALSGPYAVLIFFVLSGVVLAGAAERTRARLGATLLRRYARLGLPCAASLLLCWLVARLQIGRVPELTTLLHAPVQPPTPDLSAGHLGAELLGRYFWDGGSDLNGVLWTMQTELIGSAIIYAVMLRPWRWQVGMLAAVSAVCVWQGGPANRLLCFVVGWALHAWRGRARPVAWPIVAACGTVAVLLGGMPWWPAQGTAYRFLLDLAGPAPLDTVRITAATLTVAAVLVSPTLGSVLAAGPVRWLGRVSFGLYLTHTVVLEALSRAAFTELTRFSGGRAWALTAMAGIAIAASLALADLFTRAVDQPVLALLRTREAMSSARRGEGS